MPPPRRLQNLLNNQTPTPSPTTGSDTGFGVSDQSRFFKGFTPDQLRNADTGVLAGLPLELLGQYNKIAQEGMFGDSGWFAPTVQGIASLGNMYLGYQALNAQEDYMNNQIRLAEQQLANSQTSYNNSYDRVQQAVANSMSNEALGLPADATPEQRQQAQQAYVENQKVNHVGTQNG